MLNSIADKKILIIIGGGIAAYKVLDVIRELRKNNCEVKTIITNSGKEFVTPLSISALSKNKVFENLFDPSNETEMDHIALSRWCDLILVAPTTANLMANFARGEAKDFATTVIMASNKTISSGEDILPTPTSPHAISPITGPINLYLNSRSF